jgi:hypothetical protein
MVSRKYRFPIFIIFVFDPLQKRCIEVSLYCSEIKECLLAHVDIKFG